MLANHMRSSSFSARLSGLRGSNGPVVPLKRMPSALATASVPGTPVAASAVFKIAAPSGLRRGMGIILLMVVGVGGTARCQMLRGWADLGI